MKFCGILLISSLLVGSSCSAAVVPTRGELSTLAGIPDGTVLVSRNFLESENTSPGYWNHTAFKNGNHIVEAQVGRGVIRTSFTEYLSRNYSRILALEPVNFSVGEKAADVSETLVGLKFNQLSSLPGKDRVRAMQNRGVNCTSVIRYSERQATGNPLRRMRIPDRMFQYPELFRSSFTVR